jgi:hypothetical protein
MMLTMSIHQERSRDGYLPTTVPESTPGSTNLGMRLSSSRTSPQDLLSAELLLSAFGDETTELLLERRL